MNTTVRIILVLYCVLFAYCCLWVPWHMVQGQDRIRAGYGWLWAGPSNAPVDSILTTPDGVIIALRVVALTTLASAAVVAAWRRTQS